MLPLYLGDSSGKPPFPPETASVYCEFLQWQSWGRCPGDAGSRRLLSLPRPHFPAPSACENKRVCALGLLLAENEPELEARPRLT